MSKDEERKTRKTQTNVERQQLPPSTIHAGVAQGVLKSYGVRDQEMVARGKLSANFPRIGFIG